LFCKGRRQAPAQLEGRPKWDPPAEIAASEILKKNRGRIARCAILASLAVSGGPQRGENVGCRGFSGNSALKKRQKKKKKKLARWVPPGICPIEMGNRAHWARTHAFWAGKQRRVPAKKKGGTFKLFSFSSGAAVNSNLEKPVFVNKSSVKQALKLRSFFCFVLAGTRKGRVLWKKKKKPLPRRPSQNSSAGPAPPFRFSGRGRKWFTRRVKLGPPKKEFNRPFGINR